MATVKIFVKGMVNMILDKKEKSSTNHERALCQNDAFILAENNVFVKLRC